jgi:hypothetical protein
MSRTISCGSITNRSGLAKVTLRPSSSQKLCTERRCVRKANATAVSPITSQAMTWGIRLGGSSCIPVLCLSRRGASEYITIPRFVNAVSVLTNTHFGVRLGS